MVSCGEPSTSRPKLCLDLQHQQQEQQNNNSNKNSNNNSNKCTRYQNHHPTTTNLTMYIPICLPTLLLAPTSLATATSNITSSCPSPPPISDISKRLDCAVYARTSHVHLVLGSYIKRRRVVFETTKQLPPGRYDRFMYGLAWRWGEAKSSKLCLSLYFYLHFTLARGDIADEV